MSNRQAGICEGCNHWATFTSAVRQPRLRMLDAYARQGRLSRLLVHGANLSCRLGRPLDFGPSQSRKR